MARCGKGDVNSALDRQRGFTLMEVLVALAVLALALAAVIQGVAASNSNTAYLRERTFAHWVAMNRIAEMQTLEQWPAVGSDSGSEEMAGQRWHWRIEISDAGIEGVRRLEISVRRQIQEQQPLAQLTALLGRPD